MTTPLIDLRDVTRHYKMGEVTVQALRGLNLTVQPGEFIVLLGPSGSGKTTTLNLVGGLDRPTSGNIFVQGEDISGYSEDQLTGYRRRKVGFIFQFFNLIPTLTAAENIEFALNLTNHNGATSARIKELLTLVGLSERGDHFPSQLSGGEQQRVAIARALANNPPLLLADEPTGNLDVGTGHQVLQAMRDLNHQEKTTIVLVTHNVAIAPMADRVVRLSDGQIDAIEVNENPVAVATLDW
ncbi:MAG: ABC transporter ATP-binding protein [Candidatus Promineifilaceae bacterium]